MSQIPSITRRPHADPEPLSPERLKAFIETRLRNREAPERIANGVRAYFEVALDPDQIVPYWRGEIALPTQTEHRPDKESVQIPADQAPEPNFTVMAEVETPASTLFAIAPDAGPATGGAGEADAPATQTGRRQNAVSAPDAESLQSTTDDAATQTGRRQDAVSPQDTPPDAAATQTGRRQNQKSVLTNEIKAFIVRGLARYETPTRVAVMVQRQFGVTIDRRQVHAYHPAASRPPAQRWIDLHAATRAKFLDSVSEIGVAHKVVRLRMLDRFANYAEENFYTERAARFLAQAAKECGGFYEKQPRPNRAAGCGAS